MIKINPSNNSLIGSVHVASDMSTVNGALVDADNGRFGRALGKMGTEQIYGFDEKKATLWFAQTPDRQSDSVVEARQPGVRPQDYEALLRAHPKVSALLEQGALYDKDIELLIALALKGGNPAAVWALTNILPQKQTAAFLAIKKQLGVNDLEQFINKLFAASNTGISTAGLPEGSNEAQWLGIQRKTATGTNQRDEFTQFILQRSGLYTSEFSVLTHAWQSFQAWVDTSESAGVVQDISEQFLKRGKNAQVEFNTQNLTLSLKPVTTRALKPLHIQFDKNYKPVRAVLGEVADFGSSAAQGQVITEPKELNMLLATIDQVTKQNHRISLREYVMRKTQPGAYIRYQAAKYNRVPVEVSDKLMVGLFDDPKVESSGRTSSNAPWISFAKDFQVAGSDSSSDGKILGEPGQVVVFSHGGQVGPLAYTASHPNMVNGDGEVQPHEVVEMLKPFVAEESVTCVLLASCHAGVNGAAKKLSQELGVPVIGYSGETSLLPPGQQPIARVSQGDRVIVFSIAKPGVYGSILPYKFSSDEYWIEHYPDGSNRPIGNEAPDRTLTSEDVIKQSMADSVSAANDSAIQDTIQEEAGSAGLVTDSLESQISDTSSDALAEQYQGFAESNGLFNLTDQQASAGYTNFSFHTKVENGAGTIGVTPYDLPGLLSGQAGDLTAPVETGEGQATQTEYQPAQIAPATVSTGNTAPEKPVASVTIEQIKREAYKTLSPQLQAQIIEAQFLNLDLNKLDLAARYQAYQALHPEVRSFSFGDYLGFQPEIINRLERWSNQNVAHDKKITALNQQADASRQLAQELEAVTAQIRQNTAALKASTVQVKQQNNVRIESLSTVKRSAPPAQWIGDKAGVASSAAGKVSHHIISTTKAGAPIGGKVNANTEGVPMISLKGKTGLDQYSQSSTIPKYLYKPNEQGQLQLHVVTESGRQLSLQAVQLSVHKPQSSSGTYYKPQSGWQNIPQLSSADQSSINQMVRQPTFAMPSPVMAPTVPAAPGSGVSAPVPVPVP